jgi:hypothetical protein
MKLKAANVTLKSLDGESLYGGVVTQEEAKANATQLLRKALADLPRMLTAEMVGKPAYDPKQGEAVLRLSIKPDRKAFDPFRERLEQVLEKVARRHESIVMHSEIVHGDFNRDWSPGERRADLALPTWFCDRGNLVKVSRGWGPDGQAVERAEQPIWPRLGNKERWCIAVCSFNDARHTTTRWNIYVLDADPIKSLGVLFGQTRLVLSLSDSTGSVVTVDDVGLGKMTWQNHMGMGLLRGNLGSDISWCRQGVRPPQYEEKPARHWLLIAPYFLCASSHLLVYAPECILERHVKLTLDELKRITDVRCQIVFRPFARRPNVNRGKEKDHSASDEQN